MKKVSNIANFQQRHSKTENSTIPCLPFELELQFITLVDLRTNVQYRVQMYFNVQYWTVVEMSVLKNAVGADSPLLIYLRADGQLLNLK